VSARGAGGRKENSEKHEAERKIDVKLYTLYADHSTARLNPTFMAEAKRLPLRFASDPHAYLSFLRKWGRYVPRSASYGGTVIIDMKFESAADNLDWSFGVEAEFDGICSGGGGVSGEGGTNTLKASSKISLIANGGDPQVAAAISDFTPSTHESTSFRGDLQTWLR
jgi:hypothetical protein